MGLALYDLVGVKWPRSSAAVFTILSALLGGLFGYSYWLSLGELSERPVFELFKPTYDVFAKDLGRATSLVRRMQLAEVYQSSHEHAIIIWTLFNKQFYRLGLDGDKVNKWTSRPDPDFQDSDKPEWRSDVELRKTFKAPAGKDPPFAGVALRWSKDPGGWEWIGWRSWHCYFQQTALLPAYQEFERGLLIGGLGSEEGDSQVYVLIDDKDSRDSGHWGSRPILGVTAPQRRPPW